jgi:pSer/pThr/pTyr-binding forkhead associated (FHA) protein
LDGDAILLTAAMIGVPNKPNQPQSASYLEIVQGPDVGKTIPLGPEVIIGRDPGLCNLVLDDQDVSRRHARISRKSDGNYFIEDLQSTNGTWLGEQRVQTGTNFMPGDLLRIGSSAFKLKIASSSSYALPVTVGRGSDNNLTVEDQEVSRYHARFYVQEGRVFLQDLDSTNGTFINDQKIKGAVALNPGSRISIGSGKYLFDGQQLLSAEGAPLFNFFDEPVRQAKPAEVKNRPSTGDIFPTGDNQFSIHFLLPGSIFALLSLLLLGFNFNLLTLIMFLMILGLMYRLRAKASANWAKAIIYWSIAMLVMLVFSLLAGMQGDGSVAALLGTAFSKLFSLLMVAFFMLSIIVLVITFRKPKKVSLLSIAITMGVSLISLVIFSAVIGYRIPGLLWLMLALIGAVVGYIWARTTRVYLENRQVMSRNSVWYIVVWGTVFAFNQILIIVTNRPPEIAMAMLVISTFIVWGTNGSIVQRYYQISRS